MIEPAADREAFHAVVSALREPTLLAYASGELCEANAAAAKLLGESAARLIGRNFADIVSDAAGLGGFLRAAARTSAPVFCRVALGQEGERTAYRCEGSLIRPARGTQPGLVLLRLIPLEAAVTRFLALNQQRDALAREVERRRVVEQALRESEERFRRMVDEMPQLAWMARPDGFIFWYNRRWYEYTGTTPEQMEGWGWQSVHDPAVLPAVVERWKHSLATGEPFEMVFPLRGVDGRFRAFLTRVAPIRDADGTVAHWFGTNTDVSAQLEAEEALRRADRRKDVFLATLAHELRNPLAPIRNSVALMHALGPLPEKVESARQIIDRQVTHLTRLVDDLLDVSRITQGKVHLRKARVSLVETIREALDAVMPSAKAASQEVHVALPGDPLHAQVDGTRISQVVLNLLSNAVKFTPRGGHIWVSALRRGGEALISVRDTGAGIAPEHLESVFEMFSQPTPAIDRAEGGLGIGLALVRGLVELHGGSVRAHSPGPGKGSEFVVRMPLAEGATPADNDRPAADGGAPRRRILVVDDNVDAASTLRQLLELAGHDVREAHDGIEAIHAAGVFQPEVVLMDIGMPRMNGYEAAREIRKQANGSRIAIIAVTGWGQENERRLSEEAGFDLHLTKPVELAQLDRLFRS